MSAPSGYTALDFVGFTDKGTYSPIVNYMRNDLVHYGGNIMRCLIDNTKNVTPVVGANWELWVGASANLVERVIAPLENNPADVAFGVGRQIIYDDWLWEVIAPIAVGDALIDYAVDPTNANIKKSAPVETQLLAVKAEADATDNMIAPTEASASSSSAAYSVGDQLILNNILYDVIAAIQIGDALTTGTGGNIKAADNLTDQLKEVDSQIQTLTNEVDSQKQALSQRALRTDLSSIIQTTDAGCTVQNGIPRGTYFYLNNTPVKALTDISYGASFTYNTNYKVVTEGGFNELNVEKGDVNNVPENSLPLLNAGFYYSTNNATNNLPSSYGVLVVCKPAYSYVLLFYGTAYNELYARNAYVESGTTTWRGEWKKVSFSN